MITYNFICPDCSNNVLAEILTDVVLSSTAIDIHIDEDGVELDYIGDETDGGTINRYQCDHCGHVLKTESDQIINSFDDLKEWLEEHGTVQLDNDYLNEDNMLN